MFVKKQAENISKPTSSLQAKNLHSRVEQLSAEIHRHSTLIISICLGLAIIAVYWPVYKYDFIRFDDGDYVVNNVNLRSGINLENIHWAFTTTRAANWHPLTWLSHTLDYQFFKNWAGGYHIVNVLFHIANSILLFYVLMRMTKAKWTAAFVAGLFALHPLHIQSVAWISERKDLLSTLFLFLTLLAYVEYIEKPKAKSYLIALILFALGLMAKPMLVTLPLILLLLDYWPLERKFSFKLFLEKIPFFIVAFASSVITYVVQKTGGSVSDFRQFGVLMRIKNAVVSYIAYIGKMFYPEKLAILYPHAGDKLSAVYVIFCSSLLILLTAFFIYFGKRHKYIVTGWLWYLITLIPVIGIIQVGAQSMADRYTYITLIGLFIIAAFGIRELAGPQNYKVGALISVLILIILSMNASSQLKYWKNSETLFGRAIEVTKDNYMMLDNYGNILLEKGKIDEAMSCFQKSLEIYPDSPATINSLGAAFLQQGNFQKASECFEHVITKSPDFVQAYVNYADILKMQENRQQAIEYYQNALPLAGDKIEIYFRIGQSLMQLQQFDKAAKAFDKIIELDPKNVDAHGSRSMALGAIGKIDGAISDIYFVLNARPDDVLMYRNLGIFLEKKGDIAGAIEAYRRGLQFDPNNINLRQLLEEDLKILNTK
jgi:tetratricopeptide (TPR) repeat protein